MSENLYGLLNVGKGTEGQAKNYTGVSPVNVNNETNEISLKYDDETLRLKDDKLSVVGGGGGAVTSVNNGTGISVDRSTGDVTISNDCVPLQALGGTGSTHVVKEGVLHHAEITMYSPSSGYNTIDIIEVTNAGAQGSYGPSSYTVSTTASEITIEVYAYYGLGIADENMPTEFNVYMMELNRDIPVNMSPLEKKYFLEKEEFNRKNREALLTVGQRMGIRDMYIPQKQDIIVGVGDKVNLSEYIKDIYFSSHNDYNYDKHEYNDLFKVSLEDCSINGLDTSTPGIKQIQIKYVGEHNTYSNKSIIIPENLYMEVRK